MSNLPVWKTQPIFISSTFTDMMDERDFLRDIIFRELDEKLSERRVRLESIDLRWGVETTTETEKKKKELMVLKVCLDEIDRCKPFFIGIIGDRYGWIPPVERMAEAEREKGFITSLTNKSVTALEIEYGVLSDKEQLRRSFFFFREPLPYHKMPEEKRAEFADIYNKEFDSKEAEKRLNNFKDLIISKVGKDNVFTYKAEWNGQNVCGLEKEFKEKVLSRLWKELDEETKALEDKRPKTWQEEERKHLEDFIENRTISFTGRVDIIKKVKNFISSGTDNNYGLCLTGEAGSGKSSLFAKIYKTLKNQKDIFLLSHAAGISPRSGSITNMLTIWIEELATELKINVEEKLKEDSKIEDLQKLFSELLYHTSKFKKVVVMVDALNQFERSIKAKFVNWLPEKTSTNIKFLFTSIEGEETENLSEREGFNINKLIPVSRTDAEEIMDIICKRYHKKLNDEAIKILLNKKKSDNSYAHSNPLWLTMAIDEFILLDSDDFGKMKDLEGSAEEKLKLLLLSTAQELPADIPRMYNYVIERSKKFGKDFSTLVLSYIGLSRFGLRESDLGGLFTTYTNYGWDKLNFAVLRRYLRSHIVQKGELGLFDFRHAQFRESLKQGLLKNPDKIKYLHKNIAEHLENIEDVNKVKANDPLYQEEVLFHYINSDNTDLAAKYLAKEKLTKLQIKAVCEIFEEFLLGSTNYPSNPINWICNNIIANEQLSDEQSIIVCRRFSHSILEYLSSSIQTDIRIEIANAIIDKLEKLNGANVGAASFVNIYSNTYRLLGDMQNDLGDLHAALNSYKLSLEKSEYLYYFSLVPENNMNSETAAVNFSIAHSCLSKQYVRLNQPQKAEEHYQESEKINKSLNARNSESIPLKHGRAVTLLEQGALCHMQGSQDDALTKYLEALDILEDLIKSEIIIESEDLKKIKSAFSEAFDRIGVIKLALGEGKTSIDFFKKAVAIREENYSKEPNDILVLNNLLVSYLHLGEAHLELVELDLAKDYFFKAENIAEKLFSINPQKIENERAKNMVIERWIEYFSKVGDNTEHERYLNSFIDNCKTLIEKIPESEELQNDYSRAMRKLAFFYADLKENEKAIQILEETLDSYNGNIPNTNHYKQEILILLSSLAEIYKRTFKFDRAQKCIEDKIWFCENVLESDSENKVYQEKLEKSNIELNDFIIFVIKLYKKFTIANPDKKFEVQRDYQEKVDFLKSRGVIIPYDLEIY